MFLDIFTGSAGQHRVAAFHDGLSVHPDIVSGHRQYCKYTRIDDNQHSIIPNVPATKEEFARAKFSFE